MPKIRQMRDDEKAARNNRDSMGDHGDVRQTAGNGFAFVKGIYI